MEDFEVFTLENIEELLRWLAELSQELADFKNRLDRLLGSLATEEDAASADSSTRLGRGNRSKSIYTHRIHTVVRAHPPYL